MYAYIKGKIDEVSLDNIIIESAGIGYLIYCDLYTLASMVVGQEAKVYTYLQVKEDSHTLYGFKDVKTKKMFETLLSVNGVGTKVALKILSKLNADEVMLAIMNDDAKAFKGISGLGTKITGRILLELRPKMGAKGESLSSAIMGNDAIVMNTNAGKTKEAIDALVGLGYSFSEASTCVKAVNTKDMSVEEIIFNALKSV